MAGKLTDILREQAEILLRNVELTFEALPEGGMIWAARGIPLWKHFYHMLHSLDKWLVDPARFEEPPFHVGGMDSLDSPAGTPLSVEELREYYLGIRRKINAHLDTLDDEALSEVLPGIGAVKPFDRLTLYIAQSRHLMYHVGFIHALLFTQSGVWPEFAGISRPSAPVTSFNKN